MVMGPVKLAKQQHLHAYLQFELEWWEATYREYLSNCYNAQDAEAGERRTHVLMHLSIVSNWS